MGEVSPGTTEEVLRKRPEDTIRLITGVSTGVGLGVWTPIQWNIPFSLKRLHYFLFLKVYPLIGPKGSTRGILVFLGVCTLSLRLFLSASLYPTPLTNPLDSLPSHPFCTEFRHPKLPPPSPILGTFRLSEILDLFCSFV